MAFTEFKITNEGCKALAAAQLSGKLAFTQISIGSGIYTGDFKESQSLVNKLFEINVINSTLEDHACILEADLSNKDLKEGYYFREIGVYAELDGVEILYAYTNAGEDAEYIPKEAASVSVEKRIKISLFVTGVSEVSILAGSVLYVTQQEFENHTESGNHDNRYYLKDEIDKTFNTKAQIHHASTTLDYGVGTTSEYGHVKVTNGNGLIVSNGTITMGLASGSTGGSMSSTHYNMLNSISSFSKVLYVSSWSDLNTQLSSLSFSNSQTSLYTRIFIVPTVSTSSSAWSGGSIIYSRSADIILDFSLCQPFSTVTFSSSESLFINSGTGNLYIENLHLYMTYTGGGSTYTPKPIFYSSGGYPNYTSTFYTYGFIGLRNCNIRKIDYTYGTSASDSTYFKIISGYNVLVENSILTQSVNTAYSVGGYYAHILPVEGIYNVECRNSKMLATSSSYVSTVVRTAVNGTAITNRFIVNNCRCYGNIYGYASSADTNYYQISNNVIVGSVTGLTNFTTGVNADNISNSNIPMN